MEHRHVSRSARLRLNKRLLCMVPVTVNYTPMTDILYEERRRQVYALLRVIQCYSGRLLLARAALCSLSVPGKTLSAEMLRYCAV